MTDLNELADRYVELWNEPDPELRFKTIAELFAEDGTHVDEYVDVKGHQAIAGIVSIAHKRFVTEGGNYFRSRGNADGFRNVVRFNWEMVSVKSALVLAAGFDFLTLNDDGRIRVDYQFMEKTTG